MKKLLALILVAVMSLSILAACGSDDKKEASGSEGSFATVAPKDDATTEDAAAPATKNNTDNTDVEVTPTGENVVIDNDICMIEIVGLNHDLIMGPYITINMVNKTDDKDISVSADYVTVNGLTRNAILYTDIRAGKTDVEDLYFYDDAEDFIDEYTDIEFKFSVTETEKYLEDPVYNYYPLEDPLAEIVYNYYPLGESKAKTYVREALPTDNIIVDNEDVTVVVTGFEDDAVWGQSVMMYVVNKSDKHLSFTAEDMSVNSIMADGVFYVNVYGGKTAYNRLYWLELEELGIDEIKEVEFTLRVYDSDDFFAGDIVNQKVTLKP